MRAGRTRKQQLGATCGGTKVWCVFSQLGALRLCGSPACRILFCVHYHRTARLITDRHRGLLSAQLNTRALRRRLLILQANSCQAYNTAILGIESAKVGGFTHYLRCSAERLGRCASTFWRYILARVSGGDARPNSASKRQPLTRVGEPRRSKKRQAANYSRWRTEVSNFRSPKLASGRVALGSYARAMWSG